MSWVTFGIAGLLAVGMTFVDPQQVMLDDLNAERQRLGRVALALDPTLAAVVEQIAAEITGAARPLAGDPAALVMERLAQRGYHAHRLVAGWAQANGPFPAVLRQWREGDLETFRSLLGADIRHFALGVGDIRGQPFYLAVGTVSQEAFYGEVGAGLDAQLTEMRRHLTERTNLARERRGLPPVRSSAALDAVAQAYAEDMLQRGYYGHYSPEGKDVLDRVKASGYRLAKVGENVGSGQTSADQVMDGWLASPDHLENLLDRDFREVGLGMAHGVGRDGQYQFLWVQVFAQPVFGRR